MPSVFYQVQARNHHHHLECMPTNQPQSQQLQTERGGSVEGPQIASSLARTGVDQVSHP